MATETPDPTHDMDEEQIASARAIIQLFTQMDGWLQASVVLGWVMMCAFVFRTRARAALEAIARLFSLRVTSRASSTASTVQPPASAAAYPAIHIHTSSAVASRRPSVHDAQEEELSCSTPPVIKRLENDLASQPKEAIDTLQGRAMVGCFTTSETK